MSDPVKAILEAHRQKHEQEEKDSAQPAAPVEPEVDERFFSLVRGENGLEEYLEFRFRTGSQTCFAFKDLTWFNYSKTENLIDLGFGLFIVTIEGRGLVPRLYDAIKARRVKWIREADDKLQDSPEFDCFIQAITVQAPQGFGEEE